MLISKEIVGGEGQEANYHETYTEGNHKLQIELRADTYQIQCRGKISHFVNGEWKVIHMFRPESLNLTKIVYQQTPNKVALEKAFKPYREQLHKIAMEVLK